jgi:hypothetical protein
MNKLPIKMTTKDEKRQIVEDCYIATAYDPKNYVGIPGIDIKTDESRKLFLAGKVDDLAWEGGVREAMMKAGFANRLSNCMNKKKLVLGKDAIEEIIVTNSELSNNEVIDKIAEKAQG